VPHGCVFDSYAFGTHTDIGCELDTVAVNDVLPLMLACTSTCEALLLVLLRAPAGVGILPFCVVRMLLIRLLAPAATVRA